MVFAFASSRMNPIWETYQRRSAPQYERQSVPVEVHAIRVPFDKRIERPELGLHFGAVGRNHAIEPWRFVWHEQLAEFLVCVGQSVHGCCLLPTSATSPRTTATRSGSSGQLPRTEG